MPGKGPAIMQGPDDRGLHLGKETEQDFYIQVIPVYIVHANDIGFQLSDGTDQVLRGTLGAKAMPVEESGF